MPLCPLINTTVFPMGLYREVAIGMTMSDFCGSEDIYYDFTEAFFFSWLILSDSLFTEKL